MNVAAIDIGTNSVRLLIADQNGVELERTMRMTRLGQGVDVSGALAADAIQRTVAVLIEYRASLVSFEVSRLRVVATSAARDARNSQVFFDAAERALGERPELLSGEEEALLSFRGATAGLAASEGPFLVVDIGGGSTEFVLGQTEPEALISLQMGCVRMAERYFMANDPPTLAEVEACLADVRGLLARVREVMDVRRARRMLGLAGTVTALAALGLGLNRYDASQTHHSVLTRNQVEAAFTLLARSNLEARRKLLAEPQRAETILGGTAVLVTILREFEISELLVSEHDILDGLCASLRT